MLNEVKCQIGIMTDHRKAVIGSLDNLLFMEREAS